MSIFGKALASFGVGAAKVDTRLEKALYRQGETIRGEVFIQGGQAEQQIDEIYLYLVVQYHVEEKDHEYVVNEFRLTDSFMIHSRETKVIPFEFQLPMDSPITTKNSHLFLKTGLDIKMAVDPKDTDGIDILPHPLIDSIITAVENIGFQLYSIDFHFDKFYSPRLPFVQCYKLSPKGLYGQYFDELKFVFTPHETEVDVIMLLDRKAIDLISSMEEALNLDERFVPFKVEEKEVKKGLTKLQKRIKELIEEFM